MIDDRWKACLDAGGGSKRRYQHCSDHSGTILYFRVLQGHSGNNLIDPMLQEYSLTFTMWDAQLIFILFTMDWYLEVKI